MHALCSFPKSHNLTQVHSLDRNRGEKVWQQAQRLFNSSMFFHVSAALCTGLCFHFDREGTGTLQGLSWEVRSVFEHVVAMCNVVTEKEEKRAGKTVSGGGKIPGIKSGKAKIHHKGWRERKWRSKKNKEREVKQTGLKWS
ncbi:hypothetical protein AMECASPLE_011130 [Ameca splendens]|uniref:Uncharacterized protein n=1 Tax=Ameca splendens TaxID=208324 RepID=A0ABV0YYN4_9TELE